MLLQQTFYRMAAHTPLMVWYATAFMGGIIAQATGYPVALPALMLLGGEALHRAQHQPRMVAWVSIMCCCLAGSWRVSSRHAEQLGLLRALPQGVCSVTGTIIDKQPTGREAYPYRATLDIHSIISPNCAPFAQPCRIRIDMRHDTPELTYGTCITLSHVLLFTRQAEHLEQHCAKQRILCNGKTTHDNATTIVAQKNATVAHQWHALRNTLIQGALQQFSAQTFSLVATMFLGYPLPNQAHNAPRELFGWWGLNHLLARSGLHLIMFLIVLSAFLACLPLAFFIKQGLTLVIIGAYSLMSWPSVSFMRAVSMMMLYGACLFTRAAPHALHIISCVALGTLWYQPLYLFSLDFQLSFALTFTLAVVTHAKKVAN